MSATEIESPLPTPLYDLHRELGARMVPFAGYAMPLQYPSGVIKEHQHCRTRAGLFDVSHMGQIRICGTDAGAALESVLPIDVIDLPVGRQRYGFLTNDRGGIMDDLMVARLEEHYIVVVNAACKARDIAYLRDRIGSRCAIEVLDDHALLALQGPRAAAVLAGLSPGVARLSFMQVCSVVLNGSRCLVSRSGYTGEDGYEIAVPAAQAEDLARALLAADAVAAIGLGARDSLRLEAGLCLYGHDLNEGTSPVEANLKWALSKVRRAGGARAGGYPGAAVVDRHFAAGVTRQLMGIRPAGKVPVREGSELVDAEGGYLGEVTSGGFGATVGAPVAMGYVAAAQAAVGTECFAVVRGRRVPVTVVKPPFVPHNYYRG